MVTSGKSQCPQCEEYKRESSFWALTMKTRERKLFCNSCILENSLFDWQTEQTLKGVFIPFYDTPVTRYFDESSKHS